MRAEIQRSVREQDEDTRTSPVKPSPSTAVSPFQLAGIAFSSAMVHRDPLPLLG
jgi:hypothetical protein